MYRSLMYKEWLKIRWGSLFMTLLLIAVNIYIYIILSYNLRFIEAADYWYGIIFMGEEFYNLLTYLPLAAGITIALSQYLPEITDRRIKLSLHLPLKENNILYTFTAFGVAVLSGIFAVAIGSLTIILCVFFPQQIVSQVLLTILPWFLAGFVGYAAVSFIVLEPTWSKRIVYILLSTAVLNLFYENFWYGIYARFLPVLLAIIILLAPAVLFSGLRLKKGIAK
ncbi:MAG: hypothetical protein Kow0037_09980 [Calditrichia bacterium]